MNKQNENIVSNNVLAENEATPGFYSQNKDQALKLFPKYLIFIYIVILKNVIFPNFDQSCYLATQNLLLLCTATVLFFFLRRLNSALSTVLNMAPGDLLCIISGSPWIIRIALWVKPKNHIIRNVLIGMIWFGFVTQVIIGMVLLARFFQKYK